VKFKEFGGNYLPAIKEPDEELHKPVFDQVSLATPCLVCLRTNGWTTGQPRLDISNVRPMAYLQTCKIQPCFFYNNKLLPPTFSGSQKNMRNTIKLATAPIILVQMQQHVFNAK